MPQILADRFITSSAGPIDLATGEAVRLRVVQAGSTAHQIAWNAWCDRFANLRHVLINPLIDYGAADRDHLFEAYLVEGPMRCSGPAAERLFTHVVRFLSAGEIALQRPVADFALRSVETGTSARPRALGVVLQRRTVYDTISDALDAARPGGACALSIEGDWTSGLRTLRLFVARAARMKGYLPITPRVLRSHPWVLDRIIERHVCIMATAGAGEDNDIAALLARLGVESARRHVLLTFGRSHERSHEAHIRIDRMGIVAMSGMVFVDPEQGPRPEDVFTAARDAEGRPGRCLAALGTYVSEPARPGAMAVHELPQAYDVALSDAAPPVRTAVKRRTEGVLDRAVARGEGLAMRGRHASAHRLLCRAAHILLNRGQAEESARASLLLAWLALDRGRIDSASRAFEQARAACPCSRSGLVATIGLGIAWTDEGRLIDGEAALRSALVAAQRTDDRELAGEAAAALGRCLYWLARFDEAVAVLRPFRDLPPCAAAVRTTIVQARVHLGEGLIPAAVRAAQSALDMATTLGNARAQASACRVLAAAVASAGDHKTATSHIRDGLRAAAVAHLPLAAARLRLTSADILGRSCGPEARRTVMRFASADYPRLLRSFARAVLARIDGVDVDGSEKAFITTSGAVMLTRPSVAGAVNPVADLEAFLELGHAAPDDHAAIERISTELVARLRATTVVVVGSGAERRVVGASGRPWHGDPHIAWRAATTGVGVPLDLTHEPCEAAEPLRYGGDVIGAVAARWTAGTMLEPERATSLLRVGALAVSPNVRALLDRVAIGTAAPAWGDLLGDSPAACALREAIARAARAPFPVLIEGESGSGKELVARAIHRLGARRDRRFCALNCAALSDELIEAELFGHARGAFTGAVGERAGLFEEADGGTLFLDEIGELSARAQAKLLRVLQDGEVRRVGENVSRRVDVRIVAATNRRLEQEAAAGRFRPDLRFRLDVVRIEVPPLRERPADVPLLANRFWSDAAARVGSRATLAPEVVSALTRYDWPGNVRELQNVMAWMAVHSPGRGRVGAAALPSHVARAGIASGGNFEAARTDFERRFIKAALASADGQRSRAAHALGVTRQGLAKMMRRLGLDR
jgi:DNA-binding NtrC family response regulator/tetratricopeptide (TPR) repeat protein